MGWMMPCCRMESASSRRDSAGNCFRIWPGEATIWSTSMCSGIPLAPTTPAVPSGPIGIRASRPRPRARPRGRLMRGPREIPDPWIWYSSRHHLLRQLAVRFSSPAGGVVDHHRLAVAGSLADPHVARYQRSENLVGIRSLDLGDDVPGQRRPGIELGHDDSPQLQAGVVLPSNKLVSVVLMYDTIPGVGIIH